MGSAKAEKSFKIYYKILPKSFLIIILIDFELNFVGFLPDRAPLKKYLCFRGKDPPAVVATWEGCLGNFFFFVEDHVN